MKLPDIRYEEIKEEVVKLYRNYKVNSIPVDAWSLAADIGVRLVPSSKLLGEERTAFGDFSAGGLKFRLNDPNGSSTQFVFYDDRAPKGRQRFTILHEIGHIVLGHREDSELAEAEADFFAKYAIAPPMLVDIVGPLDYLDIAEVFGLSRECARNSMRYYNKWLGIQGLKHYERGLLSLFAFKNNNGVYVLRKRETA